MAHAGGMCAHLRKGGAVSHHELVGGGQAVRHVQEGQRGVRPQEAIVAAGRERRMEYLHRIVCGAAPRKAGRRYDARVAQRPEVHAKLLAVVLPQQFLVDLSCWETSCSGTCRLRYNRIHMIDMSFSLLCAVTTKG